MAVAPKALGDPPAEGLPLPEQESAAPTTTASATPTTTAATRPAPDLYRKLLWLTGLRLLVGTALLVATAMLTLGPDVGVPRTVESFLYLIIGGSYFASLVSVALLRSRQYLRAIAHAQIVFDLLAATGLVYLTGGAESIFTILYPLAIVNASVGLSRAGAYRAAVGSALCFCLLAVGMEHGLIGAPASFLERVPLPPSKFALTLAANVSAFVLTAALSAYLAEQLQGARRELAERETELEALSELHLHILESIASGILTIDETGRIGYLNPAGEEITGRRVRDLRGRALRERLPTFAAAVERGLEKRGEAVLERSDGTSRTVGYSINRLGAYAGKGAGYVIVFQDLTDLRQMEQAVLRADRLGVVGKLAAGLAHEIRNPLASMCGSIELLSSSSRLNARERRLMQIVLREGERLEGLLRDFLAFARPAPPQLQPIEARRLVEETLEVFRQQASERGLKLSAEVASNLRLSADAAQMRQVLWNLLTNAADATVPGGTVRISARAESDGAVLEVQDTGIGIAREDLPHIFDPFFTTKERGTGLGLATVHRIVEAHGGRVEVQTAKGLGTTFSVYLKG